MYFFNFIPKKTFNYAPDVKFLYKINFLVWIFSKIFTLEDIVNNSGFIYYNILISFYTYKNIRLWEKNYAQGQKAFLN